MRNVTCAKREMGSTAAYDTNPGTGDQRVEAHEYAASTTTARAVTREPASGGVPAAHQTLSLSAGRGGGLVRLCRRAPRMTEQSTRLI
jgi:hypothetical protein